MLKHWERRSNYRHQRPFTAFVRVDRGTFERTQALDVGSGGLRLQMDRPLCYAQVVTINLRLDASRMLTFQARVMWVEPFPKNRTFQVGLSWSDGNRCDWHELQGWLYRQELTLGVAV